MCVECPFSGAVIPKPDTGARSQAQRGSILSQEMHFSCETLLAQWLHRILNMDIPRRNVKRRRYVRRSLYATTGLVVIAVVTVGLSRLEPAVPSVDRRTLWVDTVKRGLMLRQVRGVGSLVSTDILVVPAAVSGRVARILVLPGTNVQAETVILELSNPDLDVDRVSVFERGNPKTGH